MFTKKDIDNIDHTYFKVIASSPFAVTLESINTHHLWHLILRDEKTGSCEVYHRHSTTDPWHRQWGSKVFAKAITAIKDHDQYQMNGRRNP